jgi:hypothetical protein
VRNLDGSFTFIDAPGATATFVEGGINNSGDIVGDFDDVTGTHGFLLSGGIFTIIDVPGAKASFAIGINDFDEIVGAFDPSGAKCAASRFSRNPRRARTVQPRTPRRRGNRTEYASSKARIVEPGCGARGYAIREHSAGAELYH